MFGVTKFHSYLYGHRFTLITDHKQLLSLLDGSKPVSPQASGRIQRWALTMAAYEYSLIFRSTTQHANADALSRLPLPEKPSSVPVPAELVLLVENLENGPITPAQIRTWTLRDPLQARVLCCIREGWPSHADEELMPYWQRRTELLVLDDCILWGSRVLITKPGQEHILHELHGAHPGSSRMKALARMYVWWVSMDKVIYQWVQRCAECQQTRPMPPSAPLHPWQWPSRPWARLHVDFAGPLHGQMFLVVVDAHSKWIEVHPMSSTTTTSTIERLQTVFAQFGIPESLVSDNGPQFSSEEFRDFCRSNGVHHMLVAPYHPSSNGLAERAVQTFKQGLRKSTEGTLKDRLARVLFSYRITPQTTTGRSPAELFFGRQLRSRLDLLKPDVSRRVESAHERQIVAHDQHSRSHTFLEGEEVYDKNFSRYGPPWLSGRIVRLTGPVSGQLTTEN